MTLNIQNKSFLVIFAILGFSAHKTKLCRNGWRKIKIPKNLKD